MNKLLSLIVAEVTGKFFILGGIICEIIYKADIYLILVTVGSLIIATVSELKPRRE